MTEQLTQEQLDQEVDAMVIQLNRNQRKNWLKIGALLVLVFIGFSAAISVSVVVPGMVMAMFGQ